MFLLTVAIILLSFLFLFSVRSLVNANQTEELKLSEQKLYKALTSKRTSSYLYESELSYYVTYIIYSTENQNILATNDPFLPFLKPTDGKMVHYVEKDFFFDGDLDIVYYAREHFFDGGKIVIAVAINVDNNNLTAMFANLPMALLFMALPILLISFFVSLFITKNTMNPVVNITKTAKSMTTEKLDNLLPITGRHDEIDELSGAFNDLFMRIKADFDRERQFSSDVSHELNTPLTVISGQASLLLRWGKENPEQLEKSLLAIKDEAASMHAIIDNLLQISRIESGRIKPQILQTNPAAIFARIVEEFSTVEKNIHFDIDCDQGLQLETDPEMLHQIFTILVSNSIKFFAASEFAKEECCICLRASSLENIIILEETDNGPGISPQALPHIFERFYRADEAHSRAAGGSGLGLSIAQTLVASLGATIQAQNLQPHGFRVWLEI